MSTIQKDHPKWVDHTEVEVARVKEAGETARFLIQRRYSIIGSDWLQFVFGVVCLIGVGALAYFLVSWAQVHFR